MVHAALGEPHRLAIVDELAVADRAPSEIAETLGIDSNLLAHHLNVLEGLGLVERVASQGDRRRHYLRLVTAALPDMTPGAALTADRIVFVCTENAARSQLAQALWNRAQPVEAVSGGLQPAPQLYPGAVRTARRRGLDLTGATPGPLPELRPTDLVVTVCDRAHERLRRQGHLRQLHWSIPDPAASPRRDAYDVAADELVDRIEGLAPRVRAGTRRR